MGGPIIWLGGPMSPGCIAGKIKTVLRKNAKIYYHLRSQTLRLGHLSRRWALWDTVSDLGLRIENRCRGKVLQSKKIRILSFFNEAKKSWMLKLTWTIDAWPGAPWMNCWWVGIIVGGYERGVPGVMGLCGGVADIDGVPLGLIATIAWTAPGTKAWIFR